jgi:hypothetical protein
MRAGAWTEEPKGAGRDRGEQGGEGRTGMGSRRSSLSGKR